MALPLPPPAPQRGDRTTFSSRVDAFLTWLAALVPQLNVMTASLSSFVAGGAYAIPYSVDNSTTAAGDPGNGAIRFGNVTQSAATSLYVDTNGMDGRTYSTLINGFLASTSAVKGTLRLVSASDPTKFIVFDLTAMTSVSGYFTFAVTPRGSSADSPFGGGESLLLYFQRTGDKGEQGAVSGMPSQSQLLSTIDTVPVANGGTGSKTASGALTNLGALPVSGGDLTGSLFFGNGLGIGFKDAGGNRHSFAYLDGSGNTNLFNSGGTKFNIYNQAATSIRWSMDDFGSVTQTGSLTFPNNAPIRMADASGVPRVFAQVGSNNDVQFGNIGGKNWTLFNQAGNQIIFAVDDAGNASATKFTATSDENYKENWRQLPENFLEQFAAIERAGLFDWKDTGETDGGIGAQSLQSIAPWAVSEVKGKLRVNHAAINTAVLHALTRRVLKNEQK